MTADRTAALEPCPFCGVALFRGRGNINPYAVCRTEGCFGTKMAAVNLDDPIDIAAWNRRTAKEADRMREALEWYGEQARLARLIHSEGDAGRHALADDGGKRARAALLPSEGTKT